MLVLTRKSQEVVVVGGADGSDPILKVTVLEIQPGKVTLGFEAAADVPVHRLEVWVRIRDRRHRSPGRGACPSHRKLCFKGETMSSDIRPSPKMEQSGNVKVITFTGGQARDVENVLSRELEGLTDGSGECHVLLDFTRVAHITSDELGTLVNLHKKIKASGGRLTLFNLNPEVFEVFTATRLETLLGICR